MESIAGVSINFYIQILFFTKIIFYKNSDPHKISFINGRGLKLGYFKIFNMPLLFVSFIKL